MNLTADDLRRLLYCCNSELRARRLGKPPGPQPWLAQLVRRLELELAVSSTRQESDCAETSLETWIGSRLTADILGWDIRTVQRRCADLDGRKVGGRWIFPETVVREMREACNDDRIAS
jgi:hypothetical protein